MLLGQQPFAAQPSEISPTQSYTEPSGLPGSSQYSAQKYEIACITWTSAPKVLTSGTDLGPIHFKWWLENELIPHLQYSISIFYLYIKMQQMYKLKSFTIVRSLKQAKEHTWMEPFLEINSFLVSSSQRPLSVKSRRRWWFTICQIKDNLSNPQHKVPFNYLTLLYYPSSENQGNIVL